MRNFIAIILPLIMASSAWAGAYTKGGGGGGATESVGGDTRPTLETDRFIVGTHADPDIVLDPTTRSIDIKAHPTQGGCMTWKEGAAGGTDTVVSCVADTLSASGFCRWDGVDWYGTACAGIGTPLQVHATLGFTGDPAIGHGHATPLGVDFGSAPPTNPTNDGWFSVVLPDGVYTATWKLTAALSYVDGTKCNRVTLFTSGPGITITNLVTVDFTDAATSAPPVVSEAITQTGSATVTISGADATSYLQIRQDPCGGADPGINNRDLYIWSTVAATPNDLVSVVKIR